VAVLLFVPRTYRIPFRASPRRTPLIGAGAGAGAGARAGAKAEASGPGVESVTDIGNRGGGGSSRLVAESGLLSHSDCYGCTSICTLY
jgi:hypothetical protein